MNTEYSNRSCLVWDNGLFTHVALKLAESFGKVWYGNPNVNGFPKSNASLAGVGLPGIERVNSFWEKAHDADLIVFPDVGMADLQMECVRQGMRVWGSRMGENMEQDRWEFKKLMRDLGMPVPESYRIIGIDELRRFIQEKPDFWVKTSRFRGDFETFHAKDYDFVKPKLDEIQSDLGMNGQVYPFIVEANVPSIIETGYDGYTVDGKFSTRQGTFGVEAKDCGYVICAKPYDEFPDAVRWSNEKLASEFQRVKYRGNYHNEIRVGEDGDWYLIDPCCRCGSPPSELLFEQITNWPDIMWEGAEGRLVEPEFAYPYGVQVMLHSAWADKHWQEIKLPSTALSYVKLRNCCCIDGVYSSVPQAVGLPEIGAVIGMGDNLEEAISECMKHCNEVHGYYLECKTDCIPELIVNIHKAQENGINFTDDELPTAERLEELVQA